MTVYVFRYGVGGHNWVAILDLSGWLQNTVKFFLLDLEYQT